MKERKRCELERMRVSGMDPGGCARHEGCGGSFSTLNKQCPNSAASSNCPERVRGATRLDERGNCRLHASGRAGRKDFRGIRLAWL